jgi:hypothetical protein
MTDLATLTDEELLQWVDRSHPEVAELAARLEQRINRHDELTEALEERGLAVD